MEEQFIYTTFHPILIELLSNISGEVKEHSAYFQRLRNLEKIEGEQREKELSDICKEVTASLGLPLQEEPTAADVRKALEPSIRCRIESHIGDIDSIRSAIIGDIGVSDDLLRGLGSTLSSRYAWSMTKEREYEVITQCPKEDCAGHQKDILPIRVSEYIPELVFKEAWQQGEPLPEFNPKDFKPYCAHCGTHLEARAAMNVIYPKGDELIHAIITRVKSSGRYVDKLVDLLFYDKGDSSMKLRNITDKYAFTIVLNQPNGISEKEFRRQFWKRFGIEIPRHGDVSDEACQQLLKKLNRDFSTDRSPGVTCVEDNIKNPKEREGPDGRIVVYKRLQFNLNYSGKRFEGQIKTRDMWGFERDRTSVLSHWTWEETETALRDEMYYRKPEMRIVRQMLRHIFN